MFAVRDAFVSALGTGLTIGGIVTLVGAGLAWSLIRRRPEELEPEPVLEPAASAERERELTPA